MSVPIVTATPAAAIAPSSAPATINPVLPREPITPPESSGGGTTGHPILT